MFPKMAFAACSKSAATVFFERLLGLELDEAAVAETDAFPE